MIKNALKFTPKGKKITVTSYFDLFRYLLVVEVIDEGIGIEADQMDRLFKDFSKVKSSAELNLQGIGLGLTISKALVE